MREILFRGKRINNGEWVYGFYFCMHHDDDREHLHHFIIPLNVPIPKDKPIGEIQVEVDPSTIGQYTGLTDKNGKKIFEGDIVRTHIGNVYEFAFIERYFRFALKRKGTALGWTNSNLCEIIGNIHDNPELLEDKP